MIYCAAISSPVVAVKENAVKVNVVMKMTRMMIRVRRMDVKILSSLSNLQVLVMKVVVMMIRRKLTKVTVAAPVKMTANRRMANKLTWCLASQRTVLPEALSSCFAVLNRELQRLDDKQTN